MKNKFEKIILEKISITLRSKGFKKKGANFFLDTPESILMVQLQKSTKSNSELLIITINLGVLLKIVVEKLGQQRPSYSIPDCHWRERLGFLMPEKFDKWWEIKDGDGAVEAANDLSNNLAQYGLPTLENFAEAKSLKMLWEKGQSPGLGQMQRERYLSVLQNL